MIVIYSIGKWPSRRQSFVMSPKHSLFHGKTHNLKHLITKRTGHFDFVLIKRLNLESLFISSLVGVEKCINLIELNLSRNNIVNIIHLSRFQKLEILNISYNQIEYLNFLPDTIRCLYLEGNKISSIPELSKLGRKNNLKTISLQTKQRESQNPICRHPLYQKTMLSLFTYIEIIDFENVQSTIEIQKLLQKCISDDKASRKVFNLLGNDYIHKTFDYSMVKTFEHIQITGKIIEQESRCFEEALKDIEAFLDS